MVNNEQMYKYEVECLRNLVKQCGELLFKYGYKFDKEDRDKSIEILVAIKRVEQDNVNMWLANQSQAKFEQITGVK